MKGLLLKDFYTIWKGGRIFLILYVFMAAVSGWSYMGIWLVMMDSQTSSTFSYDHSCNWNRFAMTMPVTRKDVVRSKFLLQLLIVCGSTLAYLVLAALVSLVLRTFEVKAFCNMLFAAWLVLWVVLLMGSVSTLLLFRFPPEYARLISILIYVIPACAFMGAGSVFMQEMTDNLATLPAEFSASVNCPDECTVVLHEGKYHQVKRMFAAVGKEVQYLKRISMGPIDLDDSLHVGECRRLTEEEINLLKNV